MYDKYVSVLNAYLNYVISCIGHLQGMIFVLIDTSWQWFLQ